MLLVSLLKNDVDGSDRMLMARDRIYTMIGAKTLRRDNVAKLAKKKDIYIKSSVSPAYTDENWNILAKVIRTTTSLETLSFKFSNAIIGLQNDKVVDALAKNRTIISLDLGLNWADCGDEGAKAVAAILNENSTIQVVNLQSNNISGEGAKAIADTLKHNKILQHIDLSRNNIGVDGARAIAEALEENIELQMIDLRLNQIGVEGAKAIANALNCNETLQHIDMSSNEIGDEGLKTIVDALKENLCLQELSLENNNFSEEGGIHILNALQHIDSSAIESISLWGNQISMETMEKINDEIARIKRRFRIVGSNEGQVAAVATAAGEIQQKGGEKERSNNGNEAFPTIHTTNLPQSVTNEESDQQSKEEAKQIKGKNIEENQTTITQLQGKIAEQDEEIALGSNRSQSSRHILETVDDDYDDNDGSMKIVDSTTLRRDNVAILANEKWIDIYGQGSLAYSDDNWDILAEVIRTTTTLEKLGLRSWATSALQNDEVVDALAKNRTIKSLELNWFRAGCGNEGAKAVSAILKENSTIQKVELQHSKISNKGAKTIADALKHNKALQHIDLSTNKIIGEGVKAIADSLNHNKTLRHIDLGSNHIGNEGFKVIADVLKENKSLQTLRFVRTHMGVEGAKAIAEALKVNNALRYIDLSHNKILDKGAKAIADALKHNTSVQTIYLRWNHIGNEGTKAFAEALKESASLQTLSMVNNYIGQEGGEHILNALKQIESSVITDVVLWGDKAWEETQRKINQEVDRIQRRFRIVGPVAHPAENENKEHQEDTVVEDVKQPPHDPVRESKKPLLLLSFDDDNDEGEAEGVHLRGKRGRPATAATITPKKKKKYSFAICKAPNCTKRHKSSCNGYCTTCQFNQQLYVDDNDEESPFDDPPRLGVSGRSVKHYCKVKTCDKWSQGEPKLGMCTSHFTLYSNYQREKKKVNDDINNFLNDQKKKANDDVNNFLNAWLLRSENLHGNPIKAATPTTEVKEWMAKKLCVDRSRIDTWFYRRRKRLKKQLLPGSPGQATAIAASQLVAQTLSDKNPNLNLPSMHQTPQNQPLTANCYTSSSIQKEKGLPDTAKQVLTQWIINTSSDPYPTKEMKDKVMVRFKIENPRSLDGFMTRTRKKLKLQRKQYSPDQASDPSSMTTSIAALHLLTQTPSGTNPKPNYQAQNKQSESKMGAQTSQPRHVLLASSRPAQMNQPQAGIASTASQSAKSSQMNRPQPGMVSTVNQPANSAQMGQSRVAVGTAQVNHPKPVSMAATSMGLSQIDSTQNATNGRQCTNVAGQDTTAMETKIRELQSTVARQQAQLAGKDKDIAQRDKDIARVMMEQSQTTRQLAEQQSTIAQLRGDLAQKHEEFASMRMQMQRLNGLDEGSEHILDCYTKCCVCLEPYEEEQNSSGNQRLPIKSATCAHSLCEDCLGRYHASLMKGRSKRYIRCPQCNDKSKRAFDIQNKVVDSFLREYIQCRKGKRKYHTTLQSESEIERYKGEIDSLKGQLMKQAQQMVEVEEEAKKRVAAAEASVEEARREKSEVEASLRDAQEKQEEAKKRIAAAEAHVVEEARREKSQQQKKQMKDEQPQPQPCLALGCRDFAAAGFFCPSHEEHLNKLQQQQQWPPQPLPAAKAVKQISPVKESDGDEALRDAQEQEDLEDEFIVHL